MDRKAHQIIAAMLAFFGVRYPEAPQWTDVIEGPYQWYCQIPTADTLDHDFLVGAPPQQGLLSVDRKLFVVGINASTSRTTGVLFMEGIGSDCDPANNSPDMLADTNTAWNVVHQPQGTQRERAIGLSHFNRLIAAQSTGTDPSLVMGAGQPVTPIYRPPGGSWRINVQSDPFVLRISQIFSAAGGVALNSTWTLAGRMYGAFITSGRAQDVGLLGSPPTCPPDAAAIGRIIAARRSMGQPVMSQTMG